MNCEEQKEINKRLVPEKSDQNAPIVLSYNFDLNNNPVFEKVYQGIYYAHILGSSFSIGARLNLIEDKGEIVGMDCDLISRNLGGHLNFALKSVSGKSEFIEASNRHQIFIKLNACEINDQDFPSTQVYFERPFDRKKHKLFIQIKNKDIVNLKKLYIRTFPLQSDDYRSCDTTIG